MAIHYVENLFSLANRASSLLSSVSTYHILVILAVLACMFAAQFFIHHFFPRARATMSVILLGFHVFAVVGVWKIWNLPNYCPVGRGRILRDVFILYFLGGLGVTAGAHRLWAHRSYKANFAYRFMLMLFNSLANQGSIFHWCRDHRLHHRYSEKPPDPHNALKGFFFAHMGWLLMKKDEVVVAAGRQVEIGDLWEDYAVRLQEIFDPWWNAAVSWVLPSIYGYYFYNGFWLGFFTLASLRWVITLNATWCVNSVAHLWGPRPYNANIGPVDSFVTALVAHGEGWHNWHHQYAFDYATAEHGALRQYNPTKVFIDFFAAIGWVWDRKRATRLWHLTKLKRTERQCAALEALGDANKSVLTAATSAATSGIDTTGTDNATAADNTTATDNTAFTDNTAGTDDTTGTDNTAGTDNASMKAAGSSYVMLPTLASSVETLANLIPASCYKISVLKSTLYLLRDLIAVAVVSVFTGYTWVLVSRTKTATAAASPSFYLLAVAEFGLFVVYSLAQGTTMMAIWVAAYECAGGRFSRWKSLNGVVGHMLSVVLLIPYQARRDAAPNKPDSQHPAAAAHLCRALYEDVFSIFSVSRWTSMSSTTYLPLGGISAVVSLSVLTALFRTFGWRCLASWYLGSWLVMNMWLLLYHHLLLVKVHRAFNMKHNVGGFGVVTTAEETKEMSIDAMLDDIVDDDMSDEENEGEILDCIHVDPHSIAALQREHKKPLKRTTVDFFTSEWLKSAMLVFDRTVLLKSTDGQPLLEDEAALGGIYVRFIVRLLLFLFGSLHHHLAQINILQSIEISIPHYNATEAVRALRAYTRAHQLLSAYALGKPKQQ